MFCFRWPTNTGCVRNWYHITHHSAAILFRHVQTTATWWRNAVLTCCRHCVVNTWVNQASNVQVRKNTMADHIPKTSPTGRLHRRRDRPTTNPISNWKGSKIYCDFDAFQNARLMAYFYIWFDRSWSNVPLHHLKIYLSIMHQYDSYETSVQIDDVDSNT